MPEGRFRARRRVEREASIGNEPAIAPRHTGAERKLDDVLLVLEVRRGHRGVGHRVVIPAHPRDGVRLPHAREEVESKSPSRRYR